MQGDMAMVTLVEGLVAKKRGGRLNHGGGAFMLPIHSPKIVGALKMGAFT